LHARRGVARRADGDCVRRRRVTRTTSGAGACARIGALAGGGGRAAKSFMVCAALTMSSPCGGA
jgi:hypothetical protein